MGTGYFGSVGGGVDHPGSALVRRPIRGPVLHASPENAPGGAKALHGPLGDEYTVGVGVAN